MCSWTQEYKPGYYIQGTNQTGKEEIEVLYSPTGFGYEWKRQAKSLHSAKILITMHIKQRQIAELEKLTKQANDQAAYNEFKSKVL